MLSVCQPHQHESSVCHSSRSLIRHAIFSLTGPPRWVNCLAQFREYRCKVFFPQGHNDTLPCSETESRQPCGCQLAFFIHRAAQGHNGRLYPVWASNLQPYNYCKLRVGVAENPCLCGRQTRGIQHRVDTKNSTASNSTQVV